MTNSLVRRKLAILPLLLLPLGALTACGGTNSETDCNLNSCTVTFQRGVDASASVLGIEAKFVSVEGDMVTLEIEGQTITVPTGEAEQGEEAEGFNVNVTSVTDDQVVIKITANG